MSLVLQSLINASERAANVARACGDGTNEGALLVSEKIDGEANTRFDHDFKTLADVLAQESARFEISQRCPSLAQHVRGEECPEIKGVTIQIADSVIDTAKILSELIPETTAKKMAEAAHAQPSPSLTKHIPVDLSNLNTDDLGVWIDPIDGTTEFISGARGEAAEGHGLPCVTVLIGAYLRSTGESVIGVINQPFYDRGKGRILWGYSYAGKNVSNIVLDKNTEKRVLISGAEKFEIIEKIKASGWHVDSVPGAGHKLLNVAIGNAAAYLVSKGTTFRWDTCGPHAILKAMGGDIVSFITNKPITYNDPMNIETQKYCNSEGIIAYSSEDILNFLKDIFKKSTVTALH